MACSWAIAPVCAQDISQIAKSDPLIITGSIGTNNTYFHSSAGLGYMSPLSNSFFANLNFNIYGFSMPFSIYFSNDNLNFNYPQFSFNLSPSYKNFTAHIGQSSMPFSQYVLNMSFNGVGLEWRDKHFRASAFYGVLRRAVNDNPDDPTARMPQYRRYGWTDDLEDIDLMAGSAIELTANVENKIPAYLTVSATAIDVQGKPIPENRIKVEVSNVINASEDGNTPVVTPLKIRLTEGEPGSVALVDGLTFRIEAASGEEGAKSIVGQTINAYNHTLKARDIKVRLVGKIIVNKD